ncbi:hypothetical protein ACFWY9_42250 [Amycolatopsis sp. NPDC059027]|uniref:hypothetical protein n=1 Tax=Amycolatopsis sp. NPDC059027 TaxID=3346709 RepID=UPI00366C848E
MLVSGFGVCAGVLPGGWLGWPVAVVVPGCWVMPFWFGCWSLVCRVGSIDEEDEDEDGEEVCGVFPVSGWCVPMPEPVVAVAGPAFWVCGAGLLAAGL